MIECLKFGTTKEGKEASIYILENDSGMHVQVSDFGALILKMTERIIFIVVLFARTVKCMMPDMENPKKVIMLNLVVLVLNLNRAFREIWSSG